MAEDVKFSQDIKNFQNYGTYHYQFDVAGNEILNPSSSIFQQYYFAIPLTNQNYDQTRILSYYDPAFTEFTKPVTSSVAPAELTTDELQDQLLLAQDLNEQLTSQLEELIAANEATGTSANEQLIKDTIIGLRVSMGQGNIEADFATEFPYAPLPADQQPSQQTSTQ